MIKFSPPRIDDKIIAEVTDSLKSGWITTGPKTKLLEKKVTEYCSSKTTICLNSATAGLELVLRWFGVKEGDEVIVPVYTYCATANVVVHCGATPVFVDVNSNDFNINVEEIRKKITSRTKVIIPVDFAGFPCDYDEINALVQTAEIKSLFKAEDENQKLLGRILVLADAAHSMGALYKNKVSGSLTDISVFSFHAVKNLTTAEGGAISFNLPDNFNHEEIYKYFNALSLHGQSKDALAKFQVGGWKYDILFAGYKSNMPDLLAAIGLIEIERYKNDTLVRRKEIFDKYSKGFSDKTWAQLPIYYTDSKISSYHVFPLRIKGISEEQRNLIMDKIFIREVSVNVHFQPLPLLTVYKKLGYKIEDYPVAYDNYSREISLPVYYDLSNNDIDIVIDAVIKSVEEVIQGA